MKILIIGAGYVGLSTGVVLSESHEVRLLEIDRARVEAINRGESPIYERGLDTLLKERLAEGKLRALHTSDEIGPMDAVFICVGTPSGSDGSVDLSQVESAADFIMNHLDELLKDYLVIIMKSTVPPGTTRRYLVDRIEDQHLLDRAGVVFNPEFLREGTALDDSKNPDRTVIGCTTSKEFEVVRSIYEPIIDKDSGPYLHTNIESAELCKYASNSFLATKISFSNEIANIAEQIPGADIGEVMKCVGLDSRISPRFFGSGAGYGGSCFPKDTLGLMRVAEDLGISTPILSAVDTVNKQRPLRLVNMLESLLGNLSMQRVTVLGLAFKPNTDDTRYSPALRVIELLQNRGSIVRVHDPLAPRIVQKLELPNGVEATNDLEESLTDADAAVLVTDWPVYKETGLSGLTRFMKSAVLVDGRRVFSEEEVPSSIQYITVGRTKKSET